MIACHVRARHTSPDSVTLNPKLPRAVVNALGAVGLFGLVCFVVGAVTLALSTVH